MLKDCAQAYEDGSLFIAKNMPTQIGGVTRPLLCP